MSYEDKVNGILQVLAAIKAGTAEELTATYWKQTYQHDITFLLKQLAERNAKNRMLTKKTEDSKDLLAQALTDIDKVVQDLRKSLDHQKRVINPGRSDHMG